MALEFERVIDEAGLAEWHALNVEIVPFDHPGIVAEPYDTFVGMLPNPLPSFRVSYFVARKDGRVVANAFFGLPQIDNLHTCTLQIGVALNERRRGVGTEFVQHMLDEARKERRRTIVGTAGSPMVGTSPGNEMALQLGATAALSSVRRELRLAELDRAELHAKLELLREGACAGYDLVSWEDICPDELLSGAAAILPLVESDSPQGTLEREDEVWDDARYREYEAMFKTRRRRQLVTAAVDQENGSLAAFTDFNFPYSQHRVVSQYGTVVEPQHRGHRLGIAVKMGNLINLLDRYPDAESIQTYNASDNTHMVAVNEEMGFLPVERVTHWQLEI